MSLHSNQNWRELLTLQRQAKSGLSVRKIKFPRIDPNIVSDKFAPVFDRSESRANLRLVK